VCCYLLPAVLSLCALLSTLVAAQDTSHTFSTLDVPGARSTIPSGINTAGQIVGTFDAVTSSDGFLTDGATFTTIDVPGARNTYLQGINVVGQLVGWVFESQEIGSMAFSRHLRGGYNSARDVHRRQPRVCSSGRCSSN
jgi:hypothetical protein